MVKNELYNDLQLSILDFVHVYAGSNYSKFKKFNRDGSTS
ncbi:hypothetical protein QFZ31_000713 [Neobacillus niacini]|nr:hypothetical protein [Neobacillus niacini]